MRVRLAILGRAETRRVRGGWRRSMFRTACSSWAECLLSERGQDVKQARCVVNLAQCTRNNRPTVTGTRRIPTNARPSQCGHGRGRRGVRALSLACAAAGHPLTFQPRHRTNDHTLPTAPACHLSGCAAFHRAMRRRPHRGRVPEALRLPPGPRRLVVRGGRLAVVPELPAVRVPDVRIPHRPCPAGPGHSAPVGCTVAGRRGYVHILAAMD